MIDFSRSHLRLSVTEASCKKFDICKCLIHKFDVVLQTNHNQSKKKYTMKLFTWDGMFSYHLNGVEPKASNERIYNSHESFDI